MFFKNLQVIVGILSIFGIIFVISKLKYFILFIAWSVIIFCLGILFIKLNSNNLILQMKIDYYFRLFMNSKFTKKIQAIWYKIKNM